MVTLIVELADLTESVPIKYFTEPAVYDCSEATTVHRSALTATQHSESTFRMPYCLLTECQMDCMLPLYSICEH